MKKWKIALHYAYWRIFRIKIGNNDFFLSGDGKTGIMFIKFIITFTQPVCLLTCISTENLTLSYNFVHCINFAASYGKNVQYFGSNIGFNSGI